MGLVKFWTCSDLDHAKCCELDGRGCVGGSAVVKTKDISLQLKLIAYSSLGCESSVEHQRINKCNSEGVLRQHATSALALDEGASLSPGI